MYRIRAANTIPIGGNVIEYEKSKCINGVVDQLRYSSGSGDNLNYTWNFSNFTGQTPFGGNFIECRGIFDLIQTIGKTLERRLPGQRKPPEAMFPSLFQFLQSQSTIDLTCVIGDRIQEDSLFKCSGHSACLTDECECNEKPVFFCPGRPSGCIPFSQVCDGVANCEGGTDECMCSGALKVQCLPDKSYTACILETEYCTNEYLARTLSFLSCEDYSSVDCRKLNTTSKALRNILARDENKILEVAGVYHNKSSSLGHARYAKACEEVIRPQIQGISTFENTDWLIGLCSRVKFAMAGVSIELIFTCDLENQRNENFIWDLGQVCDAVTDCTNGHDELYCPGRFYCSGHDKGYDQVTWIDEEKVCDGVKDCANGIDECDGCPTGPLSSRKFLIRSNVLSFLAFTGGVAIVLLNIKIGYETIQTNPENKPGKIDRILRIQVAFYDLLMGVYLLVLLLFATGLRSFGEYCQLDEKWRSSLSCSTLGCLFSFSSQGSFLLITMMSLIRCLTCLNLVKDISLRAIWVISLVLGVLNLVHAILPALPLSTIQTVFRTDILLLAGQENPFISNYDEKHLRMMHSLAYNTFEDGYSVGSAATDEDSLGIEAVLADLRNTTSKPSIFDYLSIGYYGTSPLCVANIFKNQSSYLYYKITYCVIVGVLLGALTISYASILITSFLSSHSSGSNDNEYVGKLALKLSLLIGSQAVAWLSYIITVLYYSWINPAAPPGVVYEVFSLVVLPSNSLLNPIFYSTIYRSICDRALKIWNELFSPTSDQEQGDDEIQD